MTIRRKDWKYDPPTKQWNNGEYVVFIQSRPRSGRRTTPYWAAAKRDDTKLCGLNFYSEAEDSKTEAMRVCEQASAGE